jgi:hypothetical protein
MKGLRPMEEDPIMLNPNKVPPRKESSVRTMSMEKAKKLIRKTTSEHAGLFRRLAK